ncbi:hypothetical protein Aduo_000898 [Ancylostoma duodenale]
MGIYERIFFYDEQTLLVTQLIIDPNKEPPVWSVPLHTGWTSFLDGFREADKISPHDFRYVSADRPDLQNATRNDTRCLSALGLFGAYLFTLRRTRTKEYVIRSLPILALGKLIALAGLHGMWCRQVRMRFR